MKALEISGQPAGGWRVRHLLLAPHRLAFLLAMVVLAGSGLWWAAVQLDRATGVLALAPAMPPTLVHSALMVGGFIPLFFGGFLFTAGPKWLAVRAPAAREVAPVLLAQAAGWLAWLAGSFASAAVSVAGLALATLGFAGMAWRFARLVRGSLVEDRVHAVAVAAALAFGTGCLAVLSAAMAWGRWDLAREAVLSLLWGCIVAVYATVAHRMIPFFTSSALPFVRAWRPFWVLAMLLAVAAFEVLAGWAAFAGLEGSALLAVRAAVELVAGGLVLYLAWAWGLVQSLKVRLLAMLHLGFAWMGLSLVLAGAGAAIALATGQAVLPLASLHALAIGCLGSLMVAMVTRVSCGHGGRALVADDFIWSVCWAVQAAALVRVAAAMPLDGGRWLLVAAAVLWAVPVAAWALRLGDWYGRKRADGRPG